MKLSGIDEFTKELFDLFLEFIIDFKEDFSIIENLYSCHKSLCSREYPTNKVSKKESLSSILSDIFSTRFGTVISPFGFLTRIEWNKYRNLPSTGSSWFKLLTVMMVLLIEVKLLIQHQYSLCKVFG